MTEVKKYFSFFRIRFLNSLQYRAAAIGGLATQFVWGFMYINMYFAFYNSNPEAFPMGLEQLTSFIWLQQALFAVLNFFRFDNTIIDSLKNGDVATELIRPISIYDMWFSKDLAIRIAAGALRFAPVILLAMFLPKPFAIAAPASVFAFILFITSLGFAVLLVISLNMLVYVSGFFTVNMDGMKMTMVVVGTFFSGMSIPLAFFPETLGLIAQFTPFGLIANFPLSVYTGDIDINYGLFLFFMQVIWLVILQVLGRFLIKKAIKKVVVQGG